jgi:hypothetical protein
MQATSATARQESTDGAIYGYSWSQKAVPVVMLVSLFFLIVCDWIHGWYSNTYLLVGYVILAVGFLCEVAEALTRAIEIKGDALQLRQPFNFASDQTIRWSDVQQMQVAPSGPEIALYTDSSVNPALTIESQFERIDQMATEIEEHLPEDTDIRHPGGKSQEDAG